MPPPQLPSNLAPYPELVRVHHAAVAGDWGEVSAAHAALGIETLRRAAVRVVGEVKQSEAMLTPVAEAPGDMPDQLLARTMLASRLIVMGWEIRTANRADRVTENQFKQFHEHLRRAERLLIDVIARQPATVAAWNLRLITARGLQLGLSEARRRYDKVNRLAPHDWSSQGLMLDQLLPKWGGSVDQAYAFARECAQAAPPGSLSPALIVEAHLEHWSTLPEKEAAAHLAAQAVQQEVAYAAGQSVLNPAFVPVHGWVTAHGYFALFHSIAGNMPAAATHFRAVGDFDPSVVWSYFYGDSAAKYNQHRARALAKG